MVDIKSILLRWQNYGCPDCGGDCSSANPPVSCCIMQETQAALEALSLSRDRAGEQKVVAWLLKSPKGGTTCVVHKKPDDADYPYWSIQPLYASPAPDDVRRMALEEAADNLTRRANQATKQGYDTAAYCWLRASLAIRSLANTPPAVGENAWGEVMDDLDHSAKIAQEQRPDIRKEELRIHALGAAISRKDWHAVEIAHAAIRDALHAALRASSEKEPKT